MKPAACCFVFSAIVCLTAVPAHAQERDELGQMREALRSTMIQLREVNNRLALAEAEKTAQKAAADKQIATLEEQVKLLTQRSILDKETADQAKAAAEKAIAALQEQIAEQEKLLDALKRELETGQKANAAVEALAQKKEQERAAAESKSVALQRRVDEAQRVNLELYRTGREILSRYEKFGLGDAVMAREKFIGIKRTQFENLMQDYQDQLDDHRLATP